jgi:hypothetical protein
MRPEGKTKRQSGVKYPVARPKEIKKVKRP